MYLCGGAIEGGTEILRAKITLRHTGNANYFETFGDGIYDATFVVHPDCISFSPFTAFELGVRDVLTGDWKGYITYEKMEDFLDLWNILDRKVLIEKTGYL